MTRYLISFDDGAMTFPETELPGVSHAAHQVLSQAKDAGVYVTGGGVQDAISTVATPDGKVEQGHAKPHIAGFVVIDVPLKQEALEWAARWAKACRCPQEVWALMDDPEA